MPRGFPGRRVPGVLLGLPGKQKRRGQDLRVHLAGAIRSKPRLRCSRPVRAAQPGVSKPDCWRCPAKKWRGEFFTTDGLAVTSAGLGASRGLLLCPRQPPEPRLIVAASLELRSLFLHPEEGFH